MPQDIAANRILTGAVQKVANRISGGYRSMYFPGVIAAVQGNMSMLDVEMHRPRRVRRAVRDDPPGRRQGSQARVPAGARARGAVFGSGSCGGVDRGPALLIVLVSLDMHCSGHCGRSR